MAETKEINIPTQSNSNSNSSQDEQKPNQNPFISLLHNLQLNFPQFNKENNNNNKVVSTPIEKVETEKKNPDFVRVPDGKKEFPSLTLEGDESHEEASASGSSNMWQVYAIGGFMIARWLWARWNEKKADKSDNERRPGDDEPSSADN